MTSQSLSPSKIPKKIQDVLDAYNSMLITQTQFKNFQKVNSVSLPPWKARKLDELEAQYYIRFFNAQGVWRKRWDKLTKKDIATAIKIKQEMDRQK